MSWFRFSRVRKIFTVLFTFALIAAAGPTRADDDEPRYSYSNYTGNNFPSPEAAFSSLKSDVDRPSVQRIFDLAVAKNSEFYNGRPVTYDSKIQRFDGNVWLPAGWFSGGAHLDMECGNSMRWLEITGSAPNYRAVCRNYPRQTVRPPEPDLCSGCVGDPIYPSTGLKFQREVDYAGTGANQLRFERIYRSDRGGWSHNFQRAGLNFNGKHTEKRGSLACKMDIGERSGRPHCFNYLPGGENDKFVVARGDGTITTFGSDTGTATSASVKDKLTRVNDATGKLVGWSLYNAADESTEFFDATIRLASITDKAGRKATLTYSDATTPVEVAREAGLLIRVTDNAARSLNFTYDEVGRMSTMSDSSGGLYTYTYDEATSLVREGSSPQSNLTSVTYPNSKKRLYWYNELENTSGANVPRALTGITDENGDRYAIYQYDASGKAISTEHAGGVEKYVIANAGTPAASVTDPLGITNTYEFEAVAGLLKKTREIRPALADIPAAEMRTKYDVNGNVALQTDWNGISTSYLYDVVRNLETSRIEADGTPQARKISTAWHAVYRLPLTIAGPKLITKYTYDTEGKVLTRSEQATTDTTGNQAFAATLMGAARTWTYTYNTAGQVWTIDGPRTDVADKVTFEYDSAGNLASSTNAAGHITLYADYNPHGAARRITAPSGVITEIAYSPRGWVSKITRSSPGVSQVTEYEYDGVGQVSKVTLPSSVVINNVYDAAHRFKGLSDNLGNSIGYELDVLGNRIKEQVKDPNGVLSRQVSRQYDALNRLKEQTGVAQ